MIRIFWHFFIPIAGLVIVYFIFRDGSLDLWASGYWESGRKWFGNKNSFVYFYYQYGNILPYFLCVGALSSWLLSFGFVKWKAIRREALYIFSTILLGPGVLVNGILKNFIPRTRPYDLEIFGKENPFCPLLTSCAEGESFPSGHVAGIFASGVLFFALFRYSPKIARIALGISIVLGILMMFTRISQGGHFLSDTLFSWGLMHLVNTAMYCLILKNRPKSRLGFVTTVPNSPLRKISFGFLAAVSFAVLSFFALLSYDITFHRREFLDVPEQVKKLEIHIDAKEEKVNIHFSDKKEIMYDFLVLGMGLPSSEYFPDQSLEIKGDTAIYRFQLEKNAIHRSYSGRINFYFPKGLEVKKDVRAKILHVKP